MTWLESLGVKKTHKGHNISPDGAEDPDNIRYCTQNILNSPQHKPGLGQKSFLIETANKNTERFRPYLQFAGSSKGG